MHIRLRAIIVAAVVIGLLIPVTVSSVLTLGQQEQALAQQLESDHQRLTEILALGVQAPLWTISPAAARPLLESVLSDERVVAVTVFGDRNTGVFFTKEHPERRSGRQFKLERAVIYGGKTTIGRVVIEMDSGRLDAAIASYRRILGVTALGQLLLSLLLIVGVLQVRVLAPIRRLMQESAQLARRDLAQPFVWQRQDELGNLGASLEVTRQSLQALFGELETRNRELKEDIERRIVVEQALEHHRAHLEELVAERTAELNVAKDRAEVASQAKSAFLSSMSHELRTPLNAVLGYAQILKRDKGLSEKQVLGLNTIQRSGEHLLMLITDVLDLSKIEAGKFELLPGAVQLPLFLEVIGDIIRIKAEERSLLFQCEAAPDLPRVVEVDEKRLRQVLLNLLGNAVKFTERGQVSLRVRRVGDDATGVHISFEVQDSGVGMTEHEMGSIFQPFEQVGDARQRAGGTGLGLAISRQLVRLMGSDIRVKSRAGEGSLFSFELTLSAVDIDVRATAIDSDEENRVIGYAGPRKKILVVDDVVANRAMLIEMLSDVGFELSEAANGREALDQIMAAAPDLVLTDVTMPVMDGLEATRRIRQIPAIATLPVIVVSATVSQQDRAAALSAGADAFLPKPIDQTHLLREIKERLHLTWLTEGARAALVTNGDTAGPMVIPPLEELQILLDLALEGSLRRISARADHLDIMDQHLHPFTDKLRKLAAGFKLIAIQNLIEHHINASQKQ